MDISILKKLDLNDKEVVVYTKLVEYGAISVRSLAELSRLNRGTTYDILKKLQEKGLVSYYHKKSKQKFVAEDVSKLLRLVQEKEEQIGRIKKDINKIIPELKSLQEKGGDKPTTKLYEGIKGVREILEDIINSFKGEKDKEYYIYSATVGSDDLNLSYPNFTKDRIKNKIHVKAISLAEGGNLSGLDERKWLGTNDESATFIIIYNGKCAFISRDASGLPVGVIIENEMIYNTQKIIFLQLWGLL